MANHFFLDLRQSVAVVQVVQKLEETLNDENDFLKLFKDGTGANDDVDDDYLPRECAHSGANALL